MVSVDKRTHGNNVRLQAVPAFKPDERGMSPRRYERKPTLV